MATYIPWAMAERPRIAQLFQPSALALDSAGNLFIADSGTERIRQVRKDGTMTTLAGNGTAAQGAANGGPASSTPLNTPMGVAMDATGNVLVADTYNHRVLLITPSHAIRTVAGTGTGGASPEGTAPLAAQLRGPRAVCADHGGNVYIVDTSNHRVLRLPPAGTLQTAAGNGSRGSAGDEGAARLAQLNTPSSCATDSAGNLFIADTANHAIRKVNPAGVISTVAGIGVAGASGDEGAATAARLDSPRGVVADDLGDIFIADTGNHRIRLVTPDGIIHNIAGSGAAGFGGDGGPATAALLNAPQGLFLDGAGDLYFADSGNNRIRRLVPEPLAPAPVIQPAAVTVVNAFSLREGAVAPGEIAAIFGAGLGPETGVTGAWDADGGLAVTLGDVEVQFDGTAAPLFYAQSGQVNVQVPYAVAGSASGDSGGALSGEAGGSVECSGSAVGACAAGAGRQCGRLDQRGVGSGSAFRRDDVLCDRRRVDGRRECSGEASPGALPACTLTGRPDDRRCGCGDSVFGQRS